MYSLSVRIRVRVRVRISTIRVSVRESDHKAILILLIHLQNHANIVKHYFTYR